MSKTGMRIYRDGVEAARISGVTPLTTPGLPPNSARLTFSDCDKQADVHGYWVNECRPEVGGYFVAIPEGGAAYYPADKFTATFGSPL